jgi:L-glyceraldehyde 3-phosphate reductase
MFDRWIEGGLLDVLAEEGVGCIVFSPLAQGLLTDKYLVGIPQGSRAATPHGFLRREEVTSDKLVKVQKLNQVARTRGQTLAQMALAWNLRHPAVTSVLVGASQVAQVEDNVAALSKPDFSQQELAVIEQILAA